MNTDNVAELAKLLGVWVKEVSGGLNFKRPKFLKLIDLVTLGRAGRVVVVAR